MKKIRNFFCRPYTILLIPSVVVILAVIVLPLLFSLYISFTPYSLLKPELITKFIGFRNYQRLFANADFRTAFIRTVVFLTIALNLELVFGLGIALVINKITFGQRFLRTVMMFPMMFSPILVGFQFKYIFNDNIGILNNFLSEFGVKENIPWLIDEYLAMGSIIFAEIWSSTSVFAIFLLAGLFAMPKDPLEAAKVDGCSALQIFHHITLPFLKPFVYISLTIRSLDVARAFDIVKVMTGGGPAGSTEILWTLIARVGYRDAKMGSANAMAYISIVLSIFFTWYFFKKLLKERSQFEY